MHTYIHIFKKTNTQDAAREKAKKLLYGDTHTHCWGAGVLCHIYTHIHKTHIHTYIHTHTNTNTQDAAREKAKQLLYSDTLLGRRRLVSDMISPIGAKRNHAARTVINTPIQGMDAMHV